MYPVDPLSVEGRTLDSPSVIVSFMGSLEDHFSFGISCQAPCQLVGGDIKWVFVFWICPFLGLWEKTTGNPPVSTCLGLALVTQLFSGVQPVVPILLVSSNPLLPVFLKCPSLQNMTSTPKRNQLFHQGPLERQLGKRLTFYVDTLRVSENGFLHWFIGCVFPWVCSIGLELLPERGVTGK